jgi:colicin import membrane protein
MRKNELSLLLCTAWLALLCVPLSSSAQPADAASAPAVEAPRQLSEQDLARLRRSVQNSKVRAVEEARQAELQRQEQARQAEIQRRQMEAQAARQAEEDARADAAEEADRARKAAQFNAQRAASERALANSLQRLNNTVNQVQVQQAQQAERQRQQAEAQQRTERQRQVELINQANQRQDQEAARLAAQRQQSEQKRADAQAAQSTEAQRRRDEQFRQDVAAERARQAAAAAAAAPATTTGATRPVGTVPTANAGGSACRVTQPKLNDTTVTSKGEAGGIAKLRERAASTCKSYTGSEAFSADTQCRADGPYVHHCSLKGQCSGEYRICGPEQ